MRGGKKFGLQVHIDRLGGGTIEERRRGEPAELHVEVVDREITESIPYDEEPTLEVERADVPSVAQ